jgi:hypothetical protein
MRQTATEINVALVTVLSSRRSTACGLSSRRFFDDVRGLFITVLTLSSFGQCPFQMKQASAQTSSLLFTTAVNQQRTIEIHVKRLA